MDVVQLVADHAPGRLNEQEHECGETALMLAASNFEEDVARLLLDNEADANTADNSGSTALMKAASRGDEDMVKLLLSAKADVHISDDDGFTAVQLAETHIFAPGKCTCAEHCCGHVLVASLLATTNM